MINFVFTATANSSLADQRTYLNALAIDVPDVRAQTAFPEPPNGEEHVDADNGTLNLFWNPPYTGVPSSYDVYFGNTSEADIGNATTASSLYKGSDTGISFELSDIVSWETYWWRVDVVTSAGIVVPGSVWKFRPRQLAFPGAEGYGRFARGGRGGTVVKVTSLEDYNPATEDPLNGTLRWALTAITGPRAVVFDVGGKRCYILNET